MHQMYSAAVLVVIGLLCAPAYAKDGNAISDDGQIACQADVHRLCESVFPDVDQVSDCLVVKRRQLSPGCANALADPDDDEDVEDR